jgi:hypothetical protein
MGRLRARLSSSDTDRELHTHLTDAGKSLDKAIEVCKQAASGGSINSRRIREALRVIHGAAKALEGIGHLIPSGRSEDPDLLPEDTVSERHRARREAEKAARAAPQLQREGGS